MESRFSKQAELYARYRPGYPPELYRFIFNFLENRERAWDCGTGSGKVASYLADYFGEVYANDISREQLHHAPRKKNVEYHLVPAEDTGFASGLFDLITVAQAIHWMDFDKFYGEVRRTSRPSALLAVIGYGMIQIDPQLNGIINQFYEYTFSEYFSKNRRYLDERYRNIPFPFEEIPSPGFFQKYKWSLNDLEGYFNTWSTVQKFKDDKGFNPVDSVIDEISACWTKGEIKEVTFPVFLRLGRIKTRNFD